MIQLNPDCVVLELDSGNTLPCSVELMTFELLGETASWIDPEILKNVNQAVILYLRDELGKHLVTFHEFSEVLEQVLRGFGFEMTLAPSVDQPSGRVEKTDISDWLERKDSGFELMMFQRLRQELSKKLTNEPPCVLWIHGLRNCVKNHLGARRWSRKCQDLNDHLISFIRDCFDRNANSGCSLVVHA
ncbi:hypothetical protein OAM01_00775 [bacterium]|nr:hypothetical protein [bacterium]